jgi:cation/acetate symporter
MVCYVVFGGMLATTWVQIVKAVLLVCGTTVLSALVLARFDWSLSRFFAAVSHVTYTENGASVTRDFLLPGLRFTPPWGPLDLISLGIALIFGTAGLPHILVRFYTVPDARAARVSVVWAMAIIGAFYVMTTFLGFGAATLVGRDTIAANGGSNMSAPLLAKALGGEAFYAFVAAIAFATILAVVAGITISASTSFAHDVWVNVVHRGKERGEGEAVRVARITAFAIGAVSIAIAVALGPKANVAFLVALAFAVAASANLPAILLALYWRRFTAAGAIAGLATGLVSSIALILIGPSVLGKERALFPLENPGIVSVPLGFLAAWLGSVVTRQPEAEARHAELLWRAHTGEGAH